MDFTLSDEQVMLTQTARRWAADFELARPGVHAVFDHSKIDGHWQSLAEMGWLGLTVPEEFGGMGGTVLDACLVVEALSEYLNPLPFLGNALIAALALQRVEGARYDEDLAALAAGTRRLSLTVGDDLRWPPRPDSRVHYAWEWTPGDTVLAPHSDGFVKLDSKTVTPFVGQDPLRSLGQLSAVSPSGVPDQNTRIMMEAVANVATSAALIGTMAGVLNLTVEYVRSREQFGKAIGSFQAVQHMCSEMLVDLESSRSIVYAAAALLEKGDPLQAARFAATAKAWCAPASVRVTERAVQLHGGIGITWECDAHLYLRAAHLWSAAFGGELEALDTVASLSDAEDHARNNTSTVSRGGVGKETRT